MRIRADPDTQHWFLLNWFLYSAAPNCHRRTGLLTCGEADYTEGQNTILSMKMGPFDKKRSKLGKRPPRSLLNGCIVWKCCTTYCNRGQNGGSCCCCYRNRGRVGGGAMPKPVFDFLGALFYFLFIYRALTETRNKKTKII